MKKRILSCIQPTGEMHFGNYFGAIQNWVSLQQNYECFYGIVDYHAITAPFNATTLQQNTWNLVYNLLACGIEKEHLFIQSLVPEHTELGWILNCFCSYGELQRMTQFKDKTKQFQEKDNEAFISVGLFDYPVLQAADILIYKADFVPVGEDQKQHLELMRNIAQRFNTQVGREYFKLPEGLYTEAPKILSPADPTKKMGKSLGEKHYISVFAEAAHIRKQIKTAVTDSGDTPAGEMSAGVKNLFTLLKAAGNSAEYATLMQDYEAGTLKYGQLKEKTGDALVLLSTAFSERKKEIMANPKSVQEAIQDASANIRQVAATTLREVKELCGLVNIKS